MKANNMTTVTTPSNDNGDRIFAQFPTEIVRAVFIVAMRDHNSIQCVLISRQVQAWLEPILYAHILIPPSERGAIRMERLLATMQFRPTAFFALHVRSLAIFGPIGGRTTSLRPLLEKCPNVVSLSILVHAYRGLTDMVVRPREFITHTSQNFPKKLSPTSAPFFANVTHLALDLFVDRLGDFVDTLCALPSLLYLALDAYVPRVFYCEEWCEALKLILAGCTELRLCWLLFGRLHEDFAQELCDLVDDPRCVAPPGGMSVQDLAKRNLYWPSEV